MRDLTHLKITRVYNNLLVCIGKLSINGTDFGYTLEDTVRPHGEFNSDNTAIPAGVYDVDLTYSERTKRLIPKILNVPNFKDIRIHDGKDYRNSLGCVMLTQNLINWERVDTVKLNKLISVLEQSTGITIEITNAFDE